MKFTVAPESVLERLALPFNIAPITLMDTHMRFLRARIIMVATKLGLSPRPPPAPVRQPRSRADAVRPPGPQRS